MDVHGGSIRCSVIKGEGISDRAKWWQIASERDQDFSNPNFLSYRKLRQNIVDTQANVTDSLLYYKAVGKKVVGYGASAKGTVFLNTCGVTTELLSTVYDNTVLKQGKFIPGRHQRVINHDELDQINPDKVFLLAWNHYKEIVAKESQYADKFFSFRQV